MKKTTKIDYTGLDIEIEIEAAQSYVEHRINKGAPLTQRAFNQAMQKALQAHEVGMTPTELIDWTVDKGWSGINIAYTKNTLGSEAEALLESMSKAKPIPSKMQIARDYQDFMRRQNIAIEDNSFDH